MEPPPNFFFLNDNEPPPKRVRVDDDDDCFCYKGGQVEDKEITKVIFQKGLEKIDDGAFWGCYNLKSVIIPEGVTTIGKDAFKYCSKLKCVIIPEGVTTIGKDAFQGCSSLKSVIIPEGVTTIGKEAFRSCWHLSTLKLPTSLTVIGEHAFEDCRSLAEVLIPKGIAKIQDFTFSCCYNLQGVIIPEGVTVIGEKAFRSTALRNIEIPKGVTEIGKATFKDCIKLKSVIIPEGVTTIGEEAFQSCSSLIGIELPTSLTVIGSYAFSFCESLRDLIIPKGLAKIEAVTFLGCKSLERVIIAEGVTEIGYGAFAGCSALRDIEMPNSVTTIDQSAFERCKALTDVVIPKGVKTIGKEAFHECSNIESVVIQGMPDIDDDAFQGCYSKSHEEFQMYLGTLSSWDSGYDKAGQIIENKPFFAKTKNMKGDLPLHIAIRNQANDIVSKVLECHKKGARVKDKEGYTPLFLICMGIKTDHYSTTVLKEVFDAFPEAATISCRGAFPINMLVEKCIDDTEFAEELRKEVLASAFAGKLEVLLTNARDGRALKPLCNLKDRGSLPMFFLIFDEGDWKDRQKAVSLTFEEALSILGRNEIFEVKEVTHGAWYDGHKPRIDLNKQVMLGWSLLEIIADFDTEDSAAILLRIFDQLNKLEKDETQKVESTFSIQYRPQGSEEMKAVEFVSVNVIQESVLVRVADRAKICKSSVELQTWGRAYGRMFRRYRVEDKPKHISKTCIVVFGTEAREHSDGHLYESPVALKFMYDKSAFMREVEKRKGASTEFVLPVKAFFVEEERFEIACDQNVGQHFGVNLKSHLSRFSELVADWTSDSTTDVYLLVMDCGGGTDLNHDIEHQNIAGNKLVAVLSIAENIARCLQYLNETCGIIHGDVKARNFVSRGIGESAFAAIDLDNAASIDREFAGQKRTSSGYLPPEQAAIEIELRKHPGAVDPGKVKASIQYDMWCFGALFYYLCTGAQLFHVDKGEELVKPNDLEILKEWRENVKRTKLSNVKPGWPHDLLDHLLEKDPHHRPKTWDDIIKELEPLQENAAKISYKRDRLFVFQSDPLINNGQAVPRLDFKREIHMLEDALSDASTIFSKVDVTVEAATSDALQAFFDRKNLSRVLHLSGHGMKDGCVLLEDGYGGSQKLEFNESNQCDALNKWLGDGVGILKLVVVAACYSENIGKCFINAGVPYVVCCKLQDELDDLAARVFSSSFYRALACGRNLQVAFDIAKNRVRYLKHGIDDPDKEAEKFLLLPKDGENPDIPIFFTGEMEPWKPKEPPRTNTVPPLPVHFCGREVRLHNIMNANLENDLIIVHGTTGVGKTCVVAAACWYMLEERRSVPIDFLYWLDPDPSRKAAYDRRDKVAPELYRMFYDFVLKDHDLQENHQYEKSMQNLKEQLMQYCKGKEESIRPVKLDILLVIDENKTESQDYKRNLKHFICNMTTEIRPHVVKIILICSSKDEYENDDMLANGGIRAKSIDGRFSLGDALTLLQSQLPDHLKESFPKSKISELKDMLDPDYSKPKETNAFLKDIWREYLGAGFPLKIMNKAKSMKKEADLEGLVHLDFEGTVELFWLNLDPPIKNKRPDCASVEALLNRLKPPTSRYDQEKYFELYRLLGNGIRYKIVNAAKEMNDGNMKDKNMKDITMKDIENWWTPGNFWGP